MKSNPLISVIIPVYNVKEYLEECVNSVINQEYQHLEIFLIDDGSTDGSGELCDVLALKDERIHVIHQKNMGLSEARNTGIEAASGKFYIFVDSDDFIAFDMIQCLYDALVSADTNLAVCNYIKVNEQGTVFFTETVVKDIVIPGRNIALEKVYEKNSTPWVVAWSKLYRKELFCSVKFESGKLYEDEFILHKIYDQCENVACISKPLYFYRIRSDSITGNDPTIRRLDAVEAFFQRALAYKGREGFEQAMMKAVHKGIGVFDSYYHGIGWICSDELKNRNEFLQQIYRKLLPDLIRNEKGMKKISAFVYGINLFNGRHLIYCTKRRLKEIITKISPAKAN